MSLIIIFTNFKIVDGFLWFKDLSHYDPYFLLPLLSATISYNNISVSVKSL